MNSGKTRVGRAVAIAVVAALSVLLLCGPGVRPACADPPMMVKIYSGYVQSGFNGGEFDVQVVSGSVPYTTAVSTYNQKHGSPPGSLGASQFSTFCVQTNQYFTPGAPYYVDIADKTDHSNNGNMVKSLTTTVKQLFWLWNRKGLSYQYDDLGSQAAARRADAQALQNLIWREMGYITFTPSAKQNHWLTQASSVALTALGNVKVLRTYTNADLTGDGQDQLIETGNTPTIPPVPEPSVLALLAAGALPVLPAFRRRRGTG